MQLHDAQSDFRTAEITAADTALAPTDSRATFRASEIVAQNQAAGSSSPLPRLLMAGAGMFLIYFFLTKGLK